MTVLIFRKHIYFENAIVFQSRDHILWVGFSGLWSMSVTRCSDVKLINAFNYYWLSLIFMFSEKHKTIFFILMKSIINPGIRKNKKGRFAGVIFTLILQKKIANAFFEQFQIAIISDGAIFHVVVTLLECVRWWADAVCYTVAVTAEIVFSYASTYLLLGKKYFSQQTIVITTFQVASYTIFRIMIKAYYWKTILPNTKHGTCRHTLVPFALVVMGNWKRYQVLIPLTVFPLLINKDMPNMHYHLTWSPSNQLTLIKSVLLLISGHL